MKARRKRRSSNGPARAVALIRKMVGDSRRVDLVQLLADSGLWLNPTTTKRAIQTLKEMGFEKSEKAGEWSRAPR